MQHRPNKRWTPSFTAACTAGDETTARALAHAHRIPDIVKRCNPPTGFGTRSTTTIHRRTRNGTSAH